MNLGPVIVRELRSQSRQVFTYWLRVLGGALILVAWFYSQSPRFVSLNNGRYLFVSLHMTLYWVLWLLVPLLCADCISREKRQGTLGLLFLTPLKARDIVMAKGMAHGLRAITICMSVLPVLTIPFLMGGVTWPQALFSVLINSGTLCWALMAGLLASAWNKRWTAALVLAVIFSGIFHVLYAILLGLAVWPTFPSPPFFSGSNEPQSLWEMAAAGETFAAGTRMFDSFGRGAPAINQMQWISRVVAVCGFSFLFMLIGIALAAGRVQRTWQDRPPSALSNWFQNVFCQPMFLLGTYKRWMRYKLEKNPIGWLEQRTWIGRVIGWGWLAVMISVYSAACQMQSGPVERSRDCSISWLWG